MKVGDLVRCRKQDVPETELGVLIKKEYNICKVLTMTGQIITVRAEFVQKAGKKDPGWRTI